MCESCVAPILILIISMFYRKDEQVSTLRQFTALALSDLKRTDRERVSLGFT